MAAIINSTFSKKIKLTVIFVVFLSLLFSGISLSTNIPSKEINKGYFYFVFCYS